MENWMQRASGPVSSVRQLSLKMGSHVRDKNVQARDNGHMPVTVPAKDVLTLSVERRDGRSFSMSTMKRVMDVLVAGIQEEAQSRRLPTVQAFQEWSSSKLDRGCLPILPCQAFHPPHFFNDLLSQVDSNAHTRCTYILHTTHLTFVTCSISCVPSFVLTHRPDATGVGQLVYIAPLSIPMSFFCCSSRPHASKSAFDVDTRRARIIPVLRSASQTSVSRPRRYSYDLNEPPPAYSTVPRIALSENEKDALRTPRRTLQRDHTRAQDVRRSLIESDTSSILSIPSTQVTGLGSVATGATAATRRNATEHTEGHRHSLQWSDDGTRPPSYYSTTARPESLSSEGTGRMLRHPVMREGWLEGIMGNS